MVIWKKSNLSKLIYDKEKETILLYYISQIKKKKKTFFHFGRKYNSKPRIKGTFLYIYESLKEAP